MDVKISVKETPLETERLLLRAWEESDLEDFFEYSSVPGVGEMAGWPHHRSKADSKRILDSFIAHDEVYAIVYKGNNKVIGSLGLHNSWANEAEEYKDLRVKDIGYVLSKEYWGRGLMPEAVKKVIEHYFEKYQLDAFTVAHFSFNCQSKRVIEKCGFRYLKTESVNLKQFQRSCESLKYILFRKDLGK